MHFDDSEKSGRKEALQKLMDMMGGMRADKISGLKKPVAVEVDMEGSPNEEAGESMHEEDAEGEPSAEDKAKIAELYNRYCK